VNAPTRYLLTLLGAIFAALLLVHAAVRTHAEVSLYIAGLCGGFFMSAVFPLWVTP
jgi:hypothetical protein